MKKLSLLLVLLAFLSFSFAEKPARKKRTNELSRSLVFPVAGKASSIHDKWGASRGGGKRKHKGIDIHARKGTPVLAVSDGLIVERALTPIGGKTLWLKSASHGWTAYYAHLDQQLVKEGQRVKRGQVIGTVGNTGNAVHTPAHLHFGIDNGNGWTNPLPYVKGAVKLKAKAPAGKKPQLKKKAVRKVSGAKKARRR